MAVPSTVAFYISGHGFGHASRDIEVVNALGRLSPSTRVLVRTSAPRWLFDLTVSVPHEFEHVQADTGVAQRDSLTHDIPETMRRAAGFYADFARKVDREARALEERRVDVVVGDIPPLAFAAAGRAGIPSFALGNFTWDWIYEGYATSGDGARGILEQIRSAYAHAHGAWRLPMHGGFEHFATILDVPFIARRSARSPEDTRRALGLPLDRPIVLTSFGGYGLARLPFGGLDCLDAYDVVVPAATLAGAPAVRRAGVHTIAESDLYSRGPRYEDLVRAADVVLTKPGYGIIAECLANDTALVYTSRGAFREYDVLVREMPGVLRCAFISHDDLFSGRWRAALDEARSAPAPPTRPPTNGAEIVAQLIHDVSPR